MGKDVLQQTGPVRPAAIQRLNVYTGVKKKNTGR